MRAAFRRFARYLVPAAYGFGATALILLAVWGVGSVLDRARTPSPADTAPAVSTDPNGSVVVFDVNGRAVSCAVIDPPGEGVAMSCDWTREAS